MIGILLPVAACGEGQGSVCITDPDPAPDYDMSVRAVKGPDSSWVLATESGAAYLTFNDPTIKVENEDLIILPLNEAARKLLPSEDVLDAPEGDPLYRGLNASNTPVAEAIACAASGN